MLDTLYDLSVTRLKSYIPSVRNEFQNISKLLRIQEGHIRQEYKECLVRWFFLTLVSYIFFLETWRIETRWRMFIYGNYSLVLFVGGR
jgi:hypothetical protein